VTTDTTTSTTTSAAAATTAAGAAAKPEKSGGFGLDKDGFLKILVEQLRHQDPQGGGQDPSQQVQQMTQYSILEQLTNLNDAASAQADDAAMTKAVGLVGHEVKWRDAPGAAEQSGTVERVVLSPDGPLLTVSGKAGVTPSSLTEVR